MRIQLFLYFISSKVSKIFVLDQLKIIDKSSLGAYSLMAPSFRRGRGGERVSPLSKWGWGEGRDVVGQKCGRITAREGRGEGWLLHVEVARGFKEMTCRERGHGKEGGEEGGEEGGCGALG